MHGDHQVSETGDFDQAARRGATGAGKTVERLSGGWRLVMPGRETEAAMNWLRKRREEAIKEATMTVVLGCFGAAGLPDGASWRCKGHLAESRITVKSGWSDEIDRSGVVVEGHFDDLRVRTKWQEPFTLVMVGNGQLLATKPGSMGCLFTPRVCLSLGRDWIHPVLTSDRVWPTCPTLEVRTNGVMTRRQSPLTMIEVSWLSPYPSTPASSRMFVRRR